MTDHSAMRLGKKPAKHDPRVPRLATYLPATLPAPPASVDWYSKVQHWSMCGNDHAGDCALAMVAHMRLQWTLYASGTGQLATDPEVLAWYSSVTGYRADDPSTDQGTVLSDALARWLTPGYPVGPDTFDQISAFAAIDPRNWDHVRLAIEWFGSVALGVNLPVAWQKHGPWTTGPNGPVGDYEPGSWGGHAIPAVGFSGDKLYVVTWGAIQEISRDALATYADECYVVLNTDWKSVPGFTPSGIAWTTLISDMDVIRSGG